MAMLRAQRGWRIQPNGGGEQRLLLLCCFAWPAPGEAQPRWRLTSKASEIDRRFSNPP